ncbi:E3 ubiquitin-protein ligase TRIM8-like [Alosa pseudoharengus]|uniref:E3 ubiquitin-protein ligase TRIM8-like n=1 Tax=Alosa pseudoharengus TaxID=34774 RepID=UPI003F8C7213
MAENWKNCFEEELICPICLHVFVEPIQLPCKHNFCRGCISEAWAKDTGMVRCPECNHAYNQKPNLEKNIKLTNIVEKFNALNVDKTPAILQCILCRRGPPLPAQKVCLRCNAPCCQSHVQTHLQQPSPNPGHLLVEAEDVQAWSCPQHDEYRLYHCEVEQVAVCQYCCFSRCAPNHGHAVCDVEVRRNDIRHVLLKQQDRIEERVQDIEEQLYKLESDKRLVEDKVQQLKEEVRLQYQKMHQLLDEDLTKTPFSAPSHFLQCVYPCSLSSSGSEKRKHSTAFPPESSSGATAFLADSSSSSSTSGPLSKQQFLVQSPSGGGGGEGQSSQQPPTMQVPCGSAVAAAAAQHSASVFPPPPHPYPPAGSSSQQPLLPQYGGRKILMCTMDNCYCSSVPSVSRHRAHPPYPRSGSFPWAVGSQEYPHALPSGPPMSQPLQGLSMRDWMDASQTHRHPDFYGLYGQSSAKHYVTS